jgi:hypothetical protein
MQITPEDMQIRSKSSLEIDGADARFPMIPCSMQSVEWLKMIIPTHFASTGHIFLVNAPFSTYQRHIPDF